MYSMNFLVPQLLAVFDPISWLIIHYGITKVAAIAVCATLTTVVVITATMVFGYVREARKRHLDAKRSEILKSYDNENHQVNVIDMDAQGRILEQKTFESKDLDEEMKRLPGRTIVNHV